MKAGQYTPSSTYFTEREERLSKQIEAAKSELDEYKKRFRSLTIDLIERRDAVIITVTALRNMRVDLDERSAAARAQILELGSLVAQSETLSADLAEFLIEPAAEVAKIDAEIASIEGQEQRKLSKPAKRARRMESRLERLKLRKVIAEKQLAIAAVDSEMEGVNGSASER